MGHIKIRGSLDLAFSGLTPPAERQVGPVVRPHGAGSERHPQQLDAMKPLLFLATFLL